MNNVCSSFTSKYKNNYITNNYTLRLKSKVNFNLINTTSTNLITVVTSSGTQLLNDSCTTHTILLLSLIISHIFYFLI